MRCNHRSGTLLICLSSVSFQFVSVLFLRFKHIVLAMDEFCFDTGSDGIFPANDCHQLVICVMKKSFVFFCDDPEKPDFDPKILNCVPPRPGCSAAEMSTESGERIPTSSSSQRTVLKIPTTAASVSTLATEIIRETVAALPASLEQVTPRSEASTLYCKSERFFTVF